jgi:uncharacterized protein
VIVGELGEATLGDAPWRTGFAAVAKRVDTGSVWVLTNCPREKYWEGDPEEVDRQPDPALRKITPNRDYSLAKIVQASAAAPFYFDMVNLEVFRGQPGIFFDGAMTPHGNPVLQLAMTALIPAYGLGWTPEMDQLVGWNAKRDKLTAWEAGADKLLVVSVGTGQPRPMKPEWVRRPVLLSIWKAIHALTSLAYDNSQLGVTLMQWLGQSPQPWRINSELGGLENARVGRAPLWTFVRYDAPLEIGWQKQHLAKDYSAEEIARLARMDDDRVVPELYEIGERAGAALIRPAHFPDVFDPA